MKAPHLAITLGLAVVLSFATSARAQSLGIKKIRATGEARVQKKVDELNKNCGTAATFSFDWTTFGEDEEANQIAPVICETFIKEVSYSFCGAKHEMEQKAIQEKAKKLVCAFIGPNVPQNEYLSTKAGGKQTLTAKGGTLTYSYGRWAGDKETFIRKELEKQL